MGIVVLKFGGTSVTTLEKREKIISLVKRVIDNNDSPVVVVSAIGRYPDNYATDTLRSLVDDDFKENDLLATDLLMSCGEVISSVIISATLKANGIDAIPLTGGQAGIITDDNFSNANVIEYNDKLIKKMISIGKVPVVCGFQGITKDGFITTLGRGGSDTSATIIGSFLKAKRIEIYTDVDGIFNSDPRVNKYAKLIEEISYDDAYNMALHGAKVIHYKAITYPKKYNVPIYIKNILKDYNSRCTIIK